MADELDELKEVQPGDLITARFINGLIRKVKALSAGTSGTIQVPNLFGRTLSDALGLLSPSTSSLRLGTVLDAAGLVVDTTQANNRFRLIISQQPPAPLLVPVNTQVHLVLAAATSGTTPTPQPTAKPPSISRFDPLSVPIGMVLTIFGENFAFPLSDNKVTLDGADAGVPSPGSSTQALIVKVPTNIPNAPTQPGQQKTVDVKVTTPNGSSTAQVVVIPPLPEPLPEISGFDPPFADLGQTITIKGDHFGFELSAIRVRFDGNPADGVPASEEGADPPRAFMVKIPSQLPTVVQPGATKSVAVTVRVTGKGESQAVFYEISKP